MAHLQQDHPRSNTDGTPETATVTDSKSQPTHLRSCVLCRQRKVKCDRQQPCSNCLRVRAECVRPPGAGRAAKRPHQVVDPRILDRLAQLETTIKHLQHQSKGQDVGSSSSYSSIPQHTSSGRAQARDPQGFLVDEVGEGIAEPGLGRLVVGESQSRYINNIMWADLIESIDQLRGMFLDTKSREDPSQFDDSHPLYEADSPILGYLGSNAAILGYRSLAHSLQDFHPPVELSMKLFQIFNDNVIPLTHTFHMPTLTRMFWEAALRPDAIDKETEALLFAIYYSAVISLDSAQCTEIIGAPRSALVERYKFAAEQALARANLLNTQSMLLLQAAVLYVTILRADDGTRTVWSLIALVSHVARSMGLHRDGTAFNLSPFETEMRRRIWHQLDILDFRATEYHGYEPTLPEETVFDTRWPLNVNDSDLSPEMTELPPESDGATDMTFTQVRCRAMTLSRKLLRESHSPFQTRLRLLDEHDKWTAKYIERCNPSHAYQSIAMHTAYLSATRIRASTYYSELVSRKRRGEAGPFSSLDDCDSRVPGCSGSQAKPDNQTLREQLFAISIDLIRRTNEVMQDTRFERWAWYSNIYVQWQTLALLLWEICVRPPSPQCDEAWKLTTDIYDKWFSVKFRNGLERGDEFVRPMKRLMARAKHVRDAQQREQSQAQTPISFQKSETNELLIPGQQMLYETTGSASFLNPWGLDTVRTSQEYYPAIPDSMVGATAAFTDNSLNGPPPADGIGDLTYLLEMIPDNLQSQWLDSTVPRDYISAPTRPY